MSIKFQDNEKQISKVYRVTYNEFKNLLERDLGKTSLNLTIPNNQIDEVQRAYQNGIHDLVS